MSDICPYCGCMGGVHQWSGGGLCPGMDKDAEIKRLKALLTRAADALETWKGDAFSPATKALIDELRKVAE